MTTSGAPELDVVVIGGGIVGLATAHQLLQGSPGIRVAVVEREVQVGQHQSSHNSGVIHAGVYYQPGSTKAVLCRRGRVAMEAFCADHDIAVVRTGKLIVAVDEAELGPLDTLHERGIANGVVDLRLLGADELRIIEPAVAGLRGLHVPETSVVDFGAVCRAMAETVGDVRVRAEVVGIDEQLDRVRVRTTAGDLEARAVVACAGLWADQVAELAGHRPSVRIVPFRGAWQVLRPAGAALVRGNVYPVPDPRFPFLGVHFTPRHDGEVWAGPNAVLSLADRALVRRVVRDPGFWRLVGRYPRAGAAELWRDRVRRAAHQQMRRYLPDLGFDDVAWQRHPPSGVRAQAVRRDGTLVDDFVIEGAGRVLHVLNAPSPAATSSLAIGDTIADQVRTRLT